MWLLTAVLMLSGGLAAIAQVQGSQLPAVYLRGLEFEQWYELRIYPQLEILRVFANRDRDMVVVLKNTAVEPAG